MFKARIRGIYSTALTSILLKSGFEIVQPSLALEERFSLREVMDSPDLDIEDRSDRQGVEALGEANAVEAFISSLKEPLDDVILRKLPFSIGGIYKGLIEKIELTQSLALVNIGPTRTWLKIDNNRDFKGKEIIVQIKEENLEQPILSTNISVQGKLAVLIKAAEPKVSRKIIDPMIQHRLYELGLELKPEDWSILWRTAAANQPVEALKNEITSLIHKANILKEKVESLEAPVILLEGDYFVDVEFPGKSKLILDEIRGLITPTVSGHHHYKACGGSISSAVDMAERLIERGTPTVDATSLLKQNVDAELPIDGSIVDVKHVKLDGKILNLGKATVEAFDQDKLEIRFSRILSGGGIYDGLGTRIGMCDRAITEAKLGEWFLKTKYFSRDGQYRGTYVNLNTPIEIYTDKIRYVDLEVDVIHKPDGEIEVVDMEKLEDAFREGIVTEKLVNTVKEKLEEILKELKINP